MIVMMPWLVRLQAFYFGMSIFGVVVGIHLKDHPMIPSDKLLGLALVVGSSTNALLCALRAAKLYLAPKDAK